MKMVHITADLVAKGLGMKVERWATLSIQSLKQKGFLPLSPKQHFRYINLLDKEMATHIQMVDLLGSFTFLDHINRATSTMINCFVELKYAFGYINNQLMEGLCKIKPILANPKTLTCIIYFGAGVPMPNASTTSKENLLKALENFVTIGEEAALQEY